MTFAIDKLPGWDVVGAENTSDRLLIHVRPLEPEHACPRCGADPDALVRHGSRQQRVTEAPVAGRRAALVVERRRHKCSACAAVVAQPLPLVVDEHRITTRCRDQILEQAATIPLLQVAEQVGVHRMVVQRLAGTGRKPSGRARAGDTAHLQECEFCLRRFEPTALEHHHPISGGPGSHAGPTVRLCQECNRLGHGT